MSPELQLVVVGGLFSIGGVLIGALLTPLTQRYLESRRDARAAKRAKALVAGELLHAQLVMRATSESRVWPQIDGAAAAREYLPSAMWEGNRGDLVGHIDDDLLEQLVIGYATLGIDRERFVAAGGLPPERRLTDQEAGFLADASVNLGQLRQKLYPGGGWLDEIPGAPSVKRE